MADETREHHHYRQAHENRTVHADDNIYNDDVTPWDTHADQEVDALGARSLKFVMTGGDPDAVVQLSMGRDLGIYARTRTTRRRVDAVAPGRTGLLAAYVNGGTVGPVDWVHADVDPQTGEPIALHVAADVVVRDVLIQERGSVGKAIDALREAAIVGDRQRVAMERDIKALTKALAESQSRIDELLHLVKDMKHVRVEHESEATAAAWSFRTYVRPDGTNVFGVVSSDGVSRATYCARPPAPMIPVDDGARQATAAAAEAPALVASTPLEDVVAVGSDARVDADPPYGIAIVPETVEAAGSVNNADNHATGDGIDVISVVDDAVAVALADPVPAETPAVIAGLEDEVVASGGDAEPAAPAIPVPTQQRRTKGARKTRTGSADAPGSPPPAVRSDGTTPARGVKTRQSARRASAHSATGAYAQHPAVVTMARPADDTETA
jgi:hypothetical protein